MESDLLCTGVISVKEGLQPIRIWRDTNEHFGTGCVGGGVWGASPVFIRYLASPDREWRGKRVMELGAGCGTVGMALARLGASVTVSDTPEMLPVLASNVSKNFVMSSPEGGGGIGSEAASATDGPIDCVEQLWGEPLKGGPYDVVIGADIIYMDGSYEPLVANMVEAAQQGAQILMCYAPQRGEAPSLDMEEPSDRFMRDAERYFDVEVLQEDVQPPAEDKKIAPFGHECPVWIYEFRLKAGSS